MQYNAKKEEGKTKKSRKSFHSAGEAAATTLGVRVRTLVSACTHTHKQKVRR